MPTTGENATDKKSSQTAGMTNPAMNSRHCRQTGLAGKKKEEQAKERKRQNDLKKVEAEIEKLEARDTELDGMLTEETVYSDPRKTYGAK